MYFVSCYASTSDNINESFPNYDDPRWLDNVPTSGDGAFNETNKYLWNYEEIIYTDGPSTKTERIMIGVYSKDGKGIKEIIEYYALSNTNTAPGNLPKPDNGVWPDSHGDWTKDV